MQVHRIQSNQRTFGYNRIANQRLLDTIPKLKLNQEIKDYITSNCIGNMIAEESLRYAEYRGWKNVRDIWEELLVNSKVAFTTAVDRILPQLNYRKDEIKAYMEEAESLKLSEKNPDHWIYAIAQNLKESDIRDNAENAKIVMETIVNEMLPGAKFEIDSVDDVLKAQYVGHYIAEQQKMADTNANQSLQESIEKGQSLTRFYEPKTEFQKRGLDALAGMEGLKQELTMDIIEPLKDLQKAEQDEKDFGIDLVPKAVLFYGPPGCGKTTFIKGIAAQAGLRLALITRDSVGSIYVDGSAKNLGAIFDYLESIATKENPVIAFIDDIDTVAPSRKENNLNGNHKNEIGVWLDRIDNAYLNNIIVFAATNDYYNLDPALISRLVMKKEIKLPDSELRRAIFEMKLKETEHGQNLSKNKKAIDEIVKLTENFSTRSIEQYIKEVRKMAYRDNKRDMTLEDFETVIKNNQNDKIDPEKYKVTPEKDSNRKPVGFNTNA